jgi:hypothetical protein
MECVRGALLGMKIKGAQKILIAGAVLFFTAVPNERAQQNGVQQASDFTSVEYFEPPHATQMKSRLSGLEAQPLANGLLVIKQLKLETFTVDGKPEMVVEAPSCTYDTSKAMASSPGPLQVWTGDGKFHVEGEGFLWRQTNSFLTISNNVHSVIENAPENKIEP